VIEASVIAQGATTSLGVHRPMHFFAGAGLAHVAGEGHNVQEAEQRKEFADTILQRCA
jgi:hypothetical protein